MIEKSHENSIVANSAEFERIYLTSEWGVGSGNGSNPVATIDYRRMVEEFIVLNKVRSVVDIGCGDWQSTRYVNFSGSHYAGFDVVPALVEQNRAMFGAPGVTFDLMPEDAKLLPTADLLIVKDVLQHLPNAQIFAFRDSVFPKFKFCLITNSWQALNYPMQVDITAGQFRTLDLQREPYLFQGAYIHEMWNQWERIRTLLMTNK